MPPPLNSFSTLLSSTAKPFASKALGPISTTVLRQQQQQPYSAAATPNTSSISTKQPTITETSVLNSFPRPNLQPTLLQSQSLYNLQVLKALGPIQTCFNCSGPHSTEFCPC